MLHGLRRILAALLGLSAALPAAALADSAIQQLVAQDLTPAAGASMSIEVGITSDNGQIWTAGSYTVQLTALDATGTPIVSSDVVSGSDPATPGQTAVLFIPLAIPSSFTGAAVVRAHLVHASTVEDSEPIAIVVGGTTSAQTAAASPPPAAAAPSTTGAKNPSGTLANSETFAGQGNRSGVLNLTGAFDAGPTYTASAGLSTTPGANKPLVGVQTPSEFAQVGTFSPSFDKEVFSGTNGSGIDLKRAWGDAHTLEAVFLDGNNATTNPYEVDGLSYDFPVLSNPFEVTGGFVTVTGPTQPGTFFLRSGRLFGFGWTVKEPHSSLTYGVHLGFVNYFDDLSGVERADRALDLTLAFAIRRAQLAFEYDRVGPFYADVSAPGVTPDRESATGSITVPLGAIQGVFSVNGYRDDLPGSSLLQQTHFWTETAGLTYPLRNGDSLSYQAANGIQHQTGTPVAPFSGNDNEAFAYTTKRGPYQIQYSLTSTNQRDNEGTLMHVIVDGLNVSRSPVSGITVSGGYNVTQNEANVAQSTVLSSSATGSISIDRGPFTLSTQVNHSLAHPVIGLSNPPTTTYSYGVSLRPTRSAYSMSVVETENVGLVNSSSAALNLNRRF